MPSDLRSPGVYIEEVPSSVHPIAGVSTSNTAFVGFFSRGPLREPVKVTSYEEFERRFGGFRSDSEAAYQVAAYFLNGGSVAYVVRIAAGDHAAAKHKVDRLEFKAIEEGEWGNRVQVTIAPVSDDGTANVTVKLLKPRPDEQFPDEIYRKLKLVSAGTDRSVLDAINDASRLVRLSVVPPDPPTDPPDPPIPASGLSGEATLAEGKDGDPPDLDAWKAGIDSLVKVQPDVFNLLCLPGADLEPKKPADPDADTDADADDGDADVDDAAPSQFKAVVDFASGYCERHRAFLIVDPPGSVEDFEGMDDFYKEARSYPAASPNAAIYFPRLEVPDALRGGAARNVGACGTVAGLFAATDAKRGIWKAPAGTGTAIRGAALSAKLDDVRGGNLNVLAVNVLRAFPVYGNVVWGARTMFGADERADQWKYVPVRRMALHIEESLNQGLRWVVFEPNDEPLWSSIRLNVGSFMNGLFRQGAFAGPKPADAYFVKCDKTTTTEADVDRGIVNIVVGFKPLKPAEFVVLRIQQMAGQAAT